MRKTIAVLFATGLWIAGCGGQSEAQLDAAVARANAICRQYDAHQLALFRHQRLSHPRANYFPYSPAEIREHRALAIAELQDLQTATRPAKSVPRVAAYLSDLAAEIRSRKSQERAPPEILVIRSGTSSPSPLDESQRLETKLGEDSKALKLTGCPGGIAPRSNRRLVPQGSGQRIIEGSAFDDRTAQFFEVFSKLLRRSDAANVRVAKDDSQVCT